MKTDAQIHQDVLRELKWDPRVEETDVGVEVDKGIVTLTGTVSSYIKRIAAAEAAHLVSGVLDVANDIVVKIPGTARNDTDIAAEVRQALQMDIGVPHELIQSTVSDGRVTLKGTVTSWYQTEDAERDVRQLAGVRGVTNEIHVQGPSVHTEEIHKAIEDAMERRADLAAKRIKVTVVDGTVTVSGPVSSWNEKGSVLGTVRLTPGVRDVRDQLFIKAAP